MLKPIMEGHAIMKSPSIIHGLYALLLDFLDDFLYSKAMGHIESYVGLQMISILVLVSLYEVLILYRATLAHLGCVLRAMGLHSSGQHSMDP